MTAETGREGELRERRWNRDEAGWSKRENGSGLAMNRMDELVTFCAVVE